MGWGWRVELKIGLIFFCRKVLCVFFFFELVIRSLGGVFEFGVFFGGILLCWR